ncbi:MAG: flagellar hook assembly protein FlgD [Rubrivivax sp.]|nr:flagellar hook assembly protein FlgD [Rubrivivax sp.]
MTTAIDTGTAQRFLALNGPDSGATKAEDSKASADRFLTMLVTQMKNQDPLNPMDNAQITSQMAQINAVTGLEKVNTSVQALATQLMQMQTLQGAALVGRDVQMPGNTLSMSGGTGRGVVELAGKAGAVRVDVLDSGGRVVGGLDLGPREAGRATFEWKAGKLPADATYTFRASATQGSNAVPLRTLMLDRVQSVSTGSDGLTLSLQRSGSVGAADVIAFN